MSYHICCRSYSGKCSCSGSWNFRRLPSGDCSFAEWVRWQGQEQKEKKVLLMWTPFGFGYFTINLQLKEIVNELKTDLYLSKPAELIELKEWNLARSGLSENSSSCKVTFHVMDSASSQWCPWNIYCIGIGWLLCTEALKHGWTLQQPFQHFRSLVK